MADDKDSKSAGVNDPSRRHFIKNTGRAAGGFVGGTLLGSVFTGQTAQAEQSAQHAHSVSRGPETPNFQEARQFFTRSDDFNVLEAACERIFPEDEHGPGAIGLNVPYYIDKQLAGSWGINGRDYRAGPFHPQTKQTEHAKPHPERSILNRGEIFVSGLRKLNEESEKRFDARFDEASEDQQIQLLQDFENDHVEMAGITASNFFALLRQATLEGAYCDPLYGGNKNMEGWKMKEFPGPQPTYEGYIERDEFVKLEPISLASYQQK
nr:gluconate 2-dehydrogenase subunit 3 family protein [uncultured Halomonas sp.]